MTSELSTRLTAATGADPALDGDIAAAFGVACAPFTASVPECRKLVSRLLPEARLHLGYGASGVFPYAALIQRDGRITAEAPTVPLAILRALAEASLGARAPALPEI